MYTRVFLNVHGSKHTPQGTKKQAEIYQQSAQRKSSCKSIHIFVRAESIHEQAPKYICESRYICASAALTYESTAASADARREMLHAAHKNVLNCHFDSFCNSVNTVVRLGFTLNARV